MPSRVKDIVRAIVDLEASGLPLANQFIWWRRLKGNPLARFGAIILIVFYLVVIFADFIAPYPYESQTDGSLLPPTTIEEVTVFQGIIILTVLAFNLLGDGLRDALDPRNLQR